MRNPGSVAPAARTAPRGRPASRLERHLGVDVAADESEEVGPAGRGRIGEAVEDGDAVHQEAGPNRSGPGWVGTGPTRRADAAPARADHASGRDGRARRGGRHQAQRADPLPADGRTDAVGPGEVFDLEAVDRPQARTADGPRRPVDLRAPLVDHLDPGQRVPERLERRPEVERLHLGRAPAHHAGWSAFGPIRAIRRSVGTSRGSTPSLTSSTIDPTAARWRSSRSASDCDRSSRRRRSVQGPDPVPTLQEPPDGGVDIGLVHPAGAHGGGQRGPEGPPAPRHLEVETGARRGHGVGHGEPVRHDQATESPLAAQHVEEQPGLFGEPWPVEAVVGGHQAQRPALADGQLEGQEVELPQRPLVHLGADRGPLELRSLATKCLTVAMTSMDCTPRTKPAASLPDSSGSSL